MNYAELQQAIIDYTENAETSFVASIPVFVQTAERRIYNDTYVPAVRKAQIGAMTGGNQYLSLPADCIDVYSLAVVDPVSQEQKYLLNKDVSYIREAYPSYLTLGVPKFYAWYSPTALILGPTPLSNYATEVQYFAYPETIVTASTTWLGDNYDMVLLYGALREAYLYMKGEQDIVTYYDNKYMEGLNLMKKQFAGRPMDQFRRPNPMVAAR